MLNFLTSQLPHLQFHPKPFPDTDSNLVRDSVTRWKIIEQVSKSCSRIAQLIALVRRKAKYFRFPRHITGNCE